MTTSHPRGADYGETIETRRVSEAAPSSATNRAGRLVHIDALRALAVCLVVALHSGLTFVPGDGGVTFFFVISGYIITTILIRERDRTQRFDLGAFYLRRALKIAPPFVLVILVPTLVFASVHHVAWQAVLAQVFFIFNWVEALAPASAVDVLPGTSVVWSLAVEEQFYIGFALIWLAALRLRWRSGAIAAVALVALGGSLLCRVGLVLTNAGYERIWHGTDTRLEAIALGVLLALLLARHPAGWPRPLQLASQDWSLVAAAALMIAGSTILTGDLLEPAFRPTAHAWVAAILIVHGSAVGTSRLRSLYLRLAALRVVQTIGLASYSIYLVHFVLIENTRSLLDPLPAPVAITLRMVVSILVGVGVYRVVEVPALRVKAHLDRRHRA